MTQEMKSEETVEIHNGTAEVVEPTAAVGNNNGVPVEQANGADADATGPASTGQEGQEGTVQEETAQEEIVAEPTDAEIIAELQAQVAAAEQKAAEAIDKLQRTAAEFQNSRRRQEKQLSDAIDRAGSHTVQRLLPIADDLTLAFSNLPEDLDESINAWVDGFRQIGKKLESILDEQGVVAIAPDGEFDPNRHEAVSSEPSETVESGHIIATLRIGYEYKGRVLRPALVRVAM